MPITVRVDSVGAIFMAENVAILQGTKHIHMRTRFITQMVKDELMKIIYVRFGLRTSRLGRECIIT